MTGKQPSDTCKALSDTDLEGVVGGAAGAVTPARREDTAVHIDSADLQGLAAASRHAQAISTEAVGRIPSARSIRSGRIDPPKGFKP